MQYYLILRYEIYGGGSPFFPNFRDFAAFFSENFRFVSPPNLLKKFFSSHVLSQNILPLKLLFQKVLGQNGGEWVKNIIDPPLTGY